MPLRILQLHVKISFKMVLLSLHNHMLKSAQKMTNLAWIPKKIQGNIPLGDLLPSIPRRILPPLGVHTGLRRQQPTAAAPKSRALHLRRPEPTLHSHASTRPQLLPLALTSLMMPALDRLRIMILRPVLLLLSLVLDPLRLALLWLFLLLCHSPALPDLVHAYKKVFEILKNTLMVLYAMACSLL
jgi:hypothetical protein